METRKYRKQNHPAISKQHIGLDTQKIGTRRNKVQKKSKCILKTITGQKKTTEHEKGNQFQKQKKIKLVEFYLQIKPPQNQKKTQVVKCRQENHNSNRRRREKKGKEAGAAAATATIQGNVP
jgi:hypothetical protein